MSSGLADGTISSLSTGAIDKFGSSSTFTWTRNEKCAVVNVIADYVEIVIAINFDEFWRL